MNTNQPANTQPPAQPAAPAAPPAQAAAPPFTMDNLLAAMIQMSRTVTDLANTVQTHVVARGDSSDKTGVVQKPVTYDGKSMEGARLFRSAFMMWVRDNVKKFGQYDANGKIVVDPTGSIAYNRRKMISSALTFLTGEAAVWARPHIEALSENQPAFNDSWTEFLKAFKAKFEPVNAQQEAKEKLRAMKQGSRSFASYVSEFETWSPRTDWSKEDLFDRLKAGMSSEYIDRLSYYQPLATTYDKVREYGFLIDIAMNDRKGNLQAAKGLPVGSSSSGSSSQASAFRDPNAMEIDAAKLDEYMTNVTPRDKQTLIKAWQKWMKTRCSICGSTSHRKDTGKHTGDNVCNHCGKKGHWGSVCLTRFIGGGKQTVAATSTEVASTSSATQDQGAVIAALQDSIALQQKQMTELLAKIGQGF